MPLRNAPSVTSRNRTYCWHRSGPVASQVDPTKAGRTPPRLSGNAAPAPAAAPPPKSPPAPQKPGTCRCSARVVAVDERASCKCVMCTYCTVLSDVAGQIATATDFVAGRHRGADAAVRAGRRDGHGRAEQRRDAQPPGRIVPGRRLQPAAVPD